MSGAIQRTCLFCDEPAGSREHAFPRWLQEFSNPTLHPGEIVRSGATHPASGHNNFITKAICHRCNSGWLARDFEEPAAPLLRAMWEVGSEGQDPIELTAEQQTFISAWAYKTTLLLTSCLDGGTEIAKGEFEMFRETRTPPVESLIRLSSSDFPTLAVTITKIRADRETNPSYPVMVDANAAGFIALLIVGPLVFWIVRAPVDYLADERFHAPFPAIWPVPLSPLWPAQETLRKQDLEALVSHLNARPDFGDQPLRG